MKKAQRFAFVTFILLAASEAMADPVSLITYAAATYFTEYALAITIAGPAVGGAYSRRRGQGEQS